MLEGIDTRGIPTHSCLNCGCEVFIIRATFDDYEIAMWWTEGTCADCGAPVTVPTPLDNPLENDV